MLLPLARNNWTGNGNGHVGIHSQPRFFCRIVAPEESSEYGILDAMLRTGVSDRETERLDLKAWFEKASS